MIYEESQQFKQWWLWLLLFAVLFIPIYGLYQQVYLNQPFGNNPAPDWFLFLMLLSIIALLGLFYFAKLHTKIDHHGISMRFFPFITRHYPVDQITHLSVINYGFVGGWGIRLWTPHGTVYNVSGNKGLKIKLKTGKSFIIGTNQPAALEHYIKQTFPHLT
jgi:hypothetical protein